MKLCYFDAWSGISGDMTVGALVDAGAPAEAIREGLNSLNTGAKFDFERTTRRGIAATRFQVDGGEQKNHRHLPQILKMIDNASIPDAAKRAASAVFDRLAEAEAEVHGVAKEKVHFHEVGAVDSICDIVASCHALALLGIGQVQNSAINTGSGTVSSEHGLLPVPGPATAKLLAGKPIYARGPSVELTTPTGAAILAALSVASVPVPSMSLRCSGFGAGQKDFPDHANVLRVLIGESTDTGGDFT